MHNGINPIEKKVGKLTSASAEVRTYIFAGISKKDLTDASLHLADANNALNALSTHIQKFNLSYKVERKESTISKVINVITGEAKVEGIKKEANHHFAYYSKLMHCYSQASKTIRRVMSDFTYLRGEVNEIFDQYVIYLTDIFGDSIRSVAPELFNFKSVTYLEVEEMYRKVLMHFDSLQQDCSNLLASINANMEGLIRDTAENLWENLGSKEGMKSVAKNAAFDLMTNLLSAHTQAAELESELETLKQDMKHDTTAVKADFARLYVLFEILNNLYIPKAKLILDNSEKLLDEHLNRILSELFSCPTLSDLVDQRATKLHARRNLERDITKISLRIEELGHEKSEAEKVMARLWPDYEMGVNNEPKPPFILTKIFSFGIATRNYNYYYAYWDACYGNVIKLYTEADQIRSNCEIDISNRNNKLSEKRAALEATNAEIAQLNTSIRTELKDNRQTISAIKPHFEDVLTLLSAARSVLESKLDYKYVNKVKIQDYRHTALPQTTIQNTAEFINRMCVVNERASVAAESLSNISGDDLMSEMPAASKIPIANKRLQQVADKQAEEIKAKAKEAQVLLENSGKVLKTINSFTKLCALKERGKILDEEYDKELIKYQAEFSHDLQSIRNNADWLQSLMGHIDKAENSEELLRALASLGGEEFSFSDEDFEQIMKGEKTICI